MIGKITTDNTRWSEEELVAMSELQDLASSGDHKTSKELTEKIKYLIVQFDLRVEGLTTDQLAYEVFKKNWGLDVIHDLFYDPEVIEIYVDRPDMVSISRMGKIERVPDIKFRDNRHVTNLVLKMIKHDQDTHFDDSHPTVQCVRQDESRLTAFRNPLTEYTCFTLRKLKAIDLTKDYLIKTGTVNERIWYSLSLLARYGARILFIGPPESGKSSWLRLLTGELDITVRSVSIESDRELFLQRTYPERSVVEMEEHAQLTGGRLEQLFAGSLRFAATHLIFGEFRLDEIDAAIMAGERSRHFWSTSHFRNAREALAGIADLLLARNSGLTHEVAEKQAIRAFDTFVTVHGDHKTGIKKILEIACVQDMGEKIEFRNLAQWAGGQDEYWNGEWVFPDKPFDEFIDRMKLYGASNDELRRVGWL